MASGRNLALPVAIVAGSAIIGISIYFGLRDGLRPPPPASTMPPAASAPPVAAPADAKASKARPMTLVRPPATPAEPVPDRVHRQAQAALDALQPALSKACWTPPAAGEPESIRLPYDVTFAADGSIIAFAISEERQAYRTSVADCVRKQGRPALPVDPPGQSVRVALALRLP